MRLFEIAKRALGTAPPFFQMRGHPEYMNWGEDLLLLSKMPELTPLQQAIEAIVKDAFATTGAFDEFLENQAGSIPLHVYFRAGEIAEEAAAVQPLAAFLMSLISLVGWARALDKDLYQQFQGRFPPGWDHLPYVCASISLRVGAIESAKLLVDHTYDVLMSSKYHSIVDPALTQYRRLARKIREKYEMAISNLADDLRESCRPLEHNFRAEVGALLWSLGLVAESRILEARSNSNTLPSRRLCQLIVAHSANCIPHDSLVQYIWLEMKDRPPFNLRDHKALFGLINLRYDQSLFDMFMPESPSQVYAQTLINWFANNLNKTQGAKYLSAYEVFRFGPDLVDLSVLVRTEALANLVANEFGWLGSNEPQHKFIDNWYNVANLAQKAKQFANQHPEIEEGYGKTNTALFYLIENEFNSASNEAPLDSEGLKKLFNFIEEFRTGTLSYWLTLNPPIILGEERDALGSLLDDEDELLTELRGAYFMTIGQTLPWHYRRYAKELVIEELGREKPPMNPEIGRKRFQEVKDDLRKLHSQMHGIAPNYVKKRVTEAVILEQLVSSISDHASGS